MYEIDLGVTARDRLTGFSGVIIGRADYLTGCNQYLVRPVTLKPDGDMCDAQWFDEQRLAVVDASIHEAARAVQAATNPMAPGADRQAPTKG